MTEPAALLPPSYMRAPRDEYPKCPRCGGPCCAAMMTSAAIRGPNGDWYYHASAISLYCSRGDCNYDHLVVEFPSPVEPTPTE